jgi:hypothetical protein
MVASIQGNNEHLKIKEELIGIINLGLREQKIRELKEIYRRGIKIDYPEYPTRAASLISLLKDMNYKVKVHDMVINGWLEDKFNEIKSLTSFLKETFSLLFIYQKSQEPLEIEHLLSLVKYIKENSPEKDIVLMCVDAKKDFALSVLKKLKDYLSVVIYGEIELPLISANSNLTVEKLMLSPNTVYYGNDYIKENLLCYSTESLLNSLPLPEFTEFELDKYLKVNNYIPITLSRGCRYHCKHCPTNAIFGNRWRSLNIEKIRKLLEVIKDKIDKNVRIQVSDFDILYNLEWFKEVCKIFKAMGFSWGCRIRPDLIDEKIVKELSISGCEKIIFGADVLYDYNPSLAISLNKVITKNILVKACSICKTFGVDVALYIIPEFFPSLETILELVNQCQAKSVVLSSFRNYDSFLEKPIISEEIEYLSEVLKERNIEVTLCTGMGEGAW